MRLVVDVETSFIPLAPGTGRGIAYGCPCPSSSFVIPAKAGIQSCRIALGALDPGFRRGDGEENQRVESISDTPAGTGETAARATAA
jgi:hypothetical protein